MSASALVAIGWQVTATGCQSKWLPSGYQVVATPVLSGEYHDLKKTGNSRWLFREKKPDFCRAGDGEIVTYSPLPRRTCSTTNSEYSQATDGSWRLPALLVRLWLANVQDGLPGRHTPTPQCATWWSLLLSVAKSFPPWNTNGETR